MTSPNDADGSSVLPSVGAGDPTQLDVNDRQAKQNREAVLPYAKKALSGPISWCNWVFGITLVSSFSLLATPAAPILIAVLIAVLLLRRGLVRLWRGSAPAFPFGVALFAMCIAGAWSFIANADMRLTAGIAKGFGFLIVFGVVFTIAGISAALTIRTEWHRGLFHPEDGRYADLMAHAAALAEQRRAAARPMSRPWQIFWVSLPIIMLVSLAVYAYIDIQKNREKDAVLAAQMTELESGRGSYQDARDAADKAWKLLPRDAYVHMTQRANTVRFRIEPDVGTMEFETNAGSLEQSPFSEKPLRAFKTTVKPSSGREVINISYYDAGGQIFGMRTVDQEGEITCDFISNFSPIPRFAKAGDKGTFGDYVERKDCKPSGEIISSGKLIWSFSDGYFCHGEERVDAKEGKFVTSQLCATINSDDTREQAIGKNAIFMYQPQDKEAIRLHGKFD